MKAAPTFTLLINSPHNHSYLFWLQPLCCFIGWDTAQLVKKAWFQGLYTPSLDEILLITTPLQLSLAPTQFPQGLPEKMCGYHWTKRTLSMLLLLICIASVKEHKVKT